MYDFLFWLLTCLDRQTRRWSFAEAQKEAIELYARKHHLHISTWFEEKETAAKRGRPLFNEMVKSLQRRKAEGVIVHKIDRSARNIADWALIGELLDSGVDVRFAHEALDLRSRGGRLTADIQAVIAADYVRNLREECLKGIEGRLKQGLFPFNAPIGYLNQGAGKPKIPDPKRAPFVRLAFELYASEAHSIRSLLAALRERGFLNRAGKPITKGCLENLLQNPFYCGRIYIKRTGRSYAGIHEPLILPALFDRVQELKASRQIKRHTKHNHTFRRTISCALCNHALIGERQKGHVYMRCHSTSCPVTTIREDCIDAAVQESLFNIRLSTHQHKRLRAKASRLLRKQGSQDVIKALELQLTNLNARQDRLTDALIDHLIDRPTFEHRKLRLEQERRNLQNSYDRASKTDAVLSDVLKFLELAKSLYLHYQMAERPEKRRIAKIAFSNFCFDGKNLDLAPRNWLQKPEIGLGVLCGPPDQGRTRTRENIMEMIQALTPDESDQNGREAG